MSFYERFSRLFSTVEIEYAQSLPVLTHDNEIVFFYKENEHPEHKRVIEEIKYIARKEIKSEKESKYEASKLFPTELLDKIVGIELDDNLTIDEELDKEDAYIETYDKYYRKAYESNVTEEELTALFHELKNTVGSEALFELYRYLFSCSFQNL